MAKMKATKNYQITGWLYDEEAGRKVKCVNVMAAENEGQAIEKAEEAWPEMVGLPITAKAISVARANELLGYKSLLDLLDEKGEE